MASDTELRPFDNIDFVEKFELLREDADSVNRCIDEPTLLSLMPSVAGKRVLDIGCGLGHLTALLAERGPQSIIGIDRSATMIAKARERHFKLRIDFMMAMVADLRSNEAFDLIVSSMVMHYVRDLHAFLAEVARLLSDGGAFVFSQRHPFRTANPFLTIVDEKRAWCLSRYFEEGSRRYTWLGHPLELHHRTFETICGALSQHGLPVECLKEPRSLLPSNGRAIKEAQKFPSILACRCTRTSSAPTQQTD